MIKLVILCRESDRRFVESTLDSCAHPRWRAEDSIGIISTPDSKRRDKAHSERKIREFLNLNNALYETPTVVALRLSVSSDKVRCIAAIAEAKSHKSFEHQILPSILSNLHLDWLSRAERDLSGRWAHGTVSRATIQMWVKQFKTVGASTGIGRSFLAQLDFWQNERLIQRLGLHCLEPSDFCCVAINRHVEPGKSADVVANSARKLVKNVLDFKSSIESDDVESILFVEDCLLTGNEMSRVFLGLLGKEDPYGSPRAKPLSRPEKIFEKRIILRFGLVTNGGLATITKFLKDHNLSNISVDTQFSEKIESLKADGLNRLYADTLYDDDGCIACVSDSIYLIAFDDQTKWRTLHEREMALYVCSTLGRQLYEYYIVGRKKTISARRLDENSLGVRSMALSVAFAHSVPKETLPIFWMGGEVNVRTKKVTWSPLFPNAL